MQINITPDTILQISVIAICFIFSVAKFLYPKLPNPFLLILHTVFVNLGKEKTADEVYQIVRNEKNIRLSLKKIGQIQQSQKCLDCGCKINPERIREKDNFVYVSCMFCGTVYYLNKD